MTLPTGPATAQPELLITSISRSAELLGQPVWVYRSKLSGSGGTSALPPATERPTTSRPPSSPSVRAQTTMGYVPCVVSILAPCRAGTICRIFIATTVSAAGRGSDGRRARPDVGLCPLTTAPCRVLTNHARVARSRQRLVLHWPVACPPTRPVPGLGQAASSRSEPAAGLPRVTPTGAPGLMGHAASSRTFPSVTAVHAEAGKPTGIVALGRGAGEDDGAELLVAPPHVFTLPPPPSVARQFGCQQALDGRRFNWSRKRCSTWRTRSPSDTEASSALARRTNSTTSTEAFSTLCVPARPE